MSGMVQDALPEVQGRPGGHPGGYCGPAKGPERRGRPSQRSWMGRVALLEVLNGSGGPSEGPTGGLERLGRPSRI